MGKFDLNIIKVMTILLRALDYIDVRLVDHGQRVAYMVYKMLQAEEAYTEKEMQEICIIAALHDIGAYKTEEIDDMMKFESVNFLDHSLYGYLFLKHMSPLQKWAEVVLYHHMNYAHYCKFDYQYLRIADMIHLADRMDVVLQTKEKWLTYSELEEHKNSWFHESTIDLFRTASERYDIEGNIKNGSYLNDLTAFISAANYNDKTLLEFFKMIAYSIDFRSETTVNHVIATVSISSELAALFRLDEEQSSKIQLGAYLHDIGKISTPLAILEKRGSLSWDEMLIMRQHIDVTGEILTGRIEEEVMQIAYRHHEKLDGSGYPQKLKSDQMNLSEKIVAVADIMSALTGKRSYKDSFPKEEVVDILLRQKEKGKLCGSVIDCAVENYDRIMECTNLNSSKTTETYNNIKREFRSIKERLGKLL